MALMPFTANINVHAFSNQVIQKGAVGSDVIELQFRLTYIGFYHGKIDGVFGWGNYWALRNFHYEFGLPIDGLAGAKTKAKLVKVTKYNPNDTAKKAVIDAINGWDPTKKDRINRSFLLYIRIYFCLKEFD